MIWVPLLWLLREFTEKEKEKEKEQNDTTSKAEETSTTSDILEEGMQEGIVSGQEVF